MTLNETTPLDEMIKYGPLWLNIIELNIFFTKFEQVMIGMGECIEILLFPLTSK